MTSPLFFLLNDQLEKDFGEFASVEAKKKITLLVNILIFRYFFVLRGEEIMKFRISGILKYLDVDANDLKF